MSPKEKATEQNVYLLGTKEGYDNNRFHVMLICQEKWLSPYNLKNILSPLRATFALIVSSTWQYWLQNTDTNSFRF